MKKYFIAAFLALIAAPGMFAQSIQLPCAPGTSPISGLITRNFSTGGLLYNACVDALGNITIPNTSGLNSAATLPNMATVSGWYRFQPGETVGANPDSSGNARTAIGTAGTAPTMDSRQGLNCTASNGAVVLPASLNGALTIQALVQTAVFSGTPRAPVLGNNGGAGTSGGVGFYVVGGVNPGLPALGSQTVGQSGGGDKVQTTGGNSALAYAFSRSSVGSSPQNIAMVMDALDRIYINGKEETTNYYSDIRSSAGLMATGSFQACGSATGATQPVFYAGTLISLVFRSAVSPPAEVLNTAVAMCVDAKNHGWQLACPDEPFNESNYPAPLDVNPRLLFDGDSITVGFGLTTPWTSNITPTPTFSGGITNQGITGLTLAVMQQNADQSADQYFNPSATQSLDVIWGGTNDNCVPSAQGVMNNLVNYVKIRYQVGWQGVLPVTMISRNTADGCKDNYNPLIRAYPWRDGYIDMASVVNLGADGAAPAGGNFCFQNLGIHPTQHCANNDIVPVFNKAISRVFACQDYSCANSYATGTVAITLTAASESTNTMTFTVAAGAPAVGKCVVVAGVTPAGYNSLANECWLVLTSSAGTTFTAFNNTTGLGAGTVFGTVLIPTQADSDRYIVLATPGAAQNFNLESCQGLTGKIGTVYIKSTNTSGNTWTLVPQFAAETIDGAASLVVANGAVTLLQPVLISQAAAGCTWKTVK